MPEAVPDPPAPVAVPLASDTPVSDPTGPEAVPAAVKAEAAGALAPPATIGELKAARRWTLGTCYSPEAQ